MIAIPRPASTVILLDETSRVYLTKRPQTMKFLAGYYVFPGGAVEADDYIVTSDHLLRFHDAAPCGIGHYVAAARELFEEVGILLVNKQDGSEARMGEDAVSFYRKELVAGRLSFMELLKKERLKLNLDSLHYFGHFITPEISPIRFDTRFFLARLPAGQKPKPDRREIADAFWITPDRALSAFRSGRMPMVRPTLMSLKSLLNDQTGKPMLQT
ncbi:NUDIX hydrolase [Mesobacillus campisalis]|uniref:NUDIX hydrolase n=1 Tax=Mesobacillus campisalis TaxID=1408103 RepID=UPI000B1C6223|nr:NUDIX hydrolase [Mesobacillus campisalis]